jgi:hypothetical protein
VIFYLPLLPKNLQILQVLDELLRNRFLKFSGELGVLLLKKNLKQDKLEVIEKSTRKCSSLLSNAAELEAEPPGTASLCWAGV